MGYSLILDTSNKSLVVGLANEKVLRKTQYYAWQRQSEMTVQEVKKIMDEENISFNDLDEVILTIGPGSYTGVRIALTIGKTIALCQNIPLIEVSSLNALAGVKGRKMSIIDARSKRSYVGFYENGKKVCDDTIMKNDEILEYSKENNYELVGEVGVLGLEEKEIDLVENMFEVSKLLTKTYNVHEVKPTYLKD